MRSYLVVYSGAYIWTISMCAPPYNCLVAFVVWTLTWTRNYASLTWCVHTEIWSRFNIQWLLCIVEAYDLNVTTVLQEWYSLAFPLQHRGAPIICRSTFQFLTSACANLKEGWCPSHGLTATSVYVFSSGRFVVLMMHAIMLCSYPLFNEHVSFYILIIGSTHKIQFDVHKDDDLDRGRTAGRFPNSGEVAPWSARWCNRSTGCSRHRGGRPLW